MEDFLFFRSNHWKMAEHLGRFPVVWGLLGPVKGPGVVP